MLRKIRFIILVEIYNSNLFDLWLSIVKMFIVDSIFEVDIDDFDEDDDVFSIVVGSIDGEDDEDDFVVMLLFNIFSWMWRLNLENF